MATTNMRSSTPTGYWGPPTSTIDWCELNYEHSFYIAEFWNTISNSLFVLLGLYGLYRSIKMGFEPRFHLQFIGVMVTGFGSAMLHGRLCMHYAEVKDVKARAVARSYVTSSLIGFAFWLMDYHYCHIVRELPINPQGHAWWHMFMGISTYHGPIFMQYVRMEQLKKKVRIHDTCIGIQTIVVENIGPDSPKKPKH
ncbi:Ceramidase [Phytophthora infestans]|uniref:Ceramidase n=1 Tax=Phytophthora infestans TaxID=4787 RepID=A0A8S9V0M6_PHYIN|nr:Ceramidase [Phytophthora infestans]